MLNRKKTVAKNNAKGTMMKRTLTNTIRIGLVLVGVALTSAMSANAAGQYNIAFTETDGNGSASATGWIDVSSGGLATSGSITVSGPNAGTYSLAPGSWFPSPADAFNADNVVTVAPGSQFLDIYGLLFKGTPAGGSYTEFNLWGNGDGAPGTYSLWGWTASSGYSPQASGTATLTAVPEPTTMVAGVGAIGLVLAGMARSRRSSVARVGK